MFKNANATVLVFVNLDLLELIVLARHVLWDAEREAAIAMEIAFVPC